MSEARLLSVYFEEVSLFHAEQADEARRGSRSNSPQLANDYGMETDSVIGDDPDEMDVFEARRRARK